MTAPVSSVASSEKAAVAASSAPDSRRMTSLTRSVIGASTTRALSARHRTAVRPTGVATQATVARWVAADAANTAGDSAWPATATDCPRCFTTAHLPLDFSSVSVASATDAAQWRGCTSSAPLIVESTNSRCECP